MTKLVIRKINTDGIENIIKVVHMIGKLDEEINISVIYRCGKDEF